MGVRSRYLHRFLLISIVLSCGWSEEFCEVSYGERTRKAFGDLEASEANGTWIRRCSPTSGKPATKFKNGVLTIFPGAATRYQRQRGHMSMNRSYQLEVVEAVWIIDLSRFDYDGIERSESERAIFWTSGGKLFSRKHRETSWSFAIDLSFFAVHLNTHHEVHVAPKRRLKVQHLERGRPLDRSSSTSVYTLALDSISRANLEAMLPKTWALLKKLNLEGHRSHDVLNFKRFRTVQFGGTMQNMFPLWYGGISKPSKCEALDARTFLAHHNDPQLAMSAVLNVTSRNRHLFRAFRKAGFETACSTHYHRPPYETVVSDDIDYMFPPVWHMLSDAEALLHENACIGQLPLGMHILRYNEDLLKNGGQAPRFVFSFFRVTHPALTDRRGIEQHMSMVGRWDSLLERHLQRILAAENAPIVVFMSDHGLRTPSCDNDKPFLYMAIPRQFFEDLDRSAAESIHRNQNTIVTVWDLYETFTHIAKSRTRIPPLEANTSDALKEERQVPEELCHYPALGRAVSRVESVNMSVFHPSSLLNLIPSDRTCAEMGIADSTCGRVWAEAYYCGEVDAMSEPTQELLAPGHNFTRKDCSDFLKWVHVAISQMNVDLQHNLLKYQPAREEDLPCVSSLSFGSLELVYLNQPLRQMTFRFSVLEGSPPRVFEAWFGSALPNSDVRVGALQEYTQVTRYMKYEFCAPRGSVMLCICGEDKVISDNKKRFSRNCFVDGYTYERCCDTRRPEPRCFDHIYTYEMCCQIALPS